MSPTAAPAPMFAGALLFSLALAGGAACAGPPVEQWVEIGVATDGTRAFVDRASLEPGRGWVKLRQRFALPRPDAGGIVKVEQHVIYACDARSVRTLRSAEYDPRGRIARQDVNFPRTYAVPRGTLPEYIFDAVC